jgi:hypothetical protein
MRHRQISLNVPRSWEEANFNLSVLQRQQPGGDKLDLRHAFFWLRIDARQLPTIETVFNVLGNDSDGYEINNNDNNNYNNNDNNNTNYNNINNNIYNA